MDRFGLFVDAGYLLAAGGQLCTGEKHRHKFSCDFGNLHQELIRFCENHSKLPILRTYWYDAAPGSPQPLPTVEHLSIAALANVKLRLGRIIFGQQKGVDSMITRDLMTLARERAMSTAYLLSGDEDLREAVVAAQDLGVQVILLGITPTAGLANQSFTLVNECDSISVLNKEFWDPFFSVNREPEALPAPLLEPMTAHGQVQTESEMAENVGKTYCETWFAEVGVETAGLLSPKLPMLPGDIDARLLRHAESVLGSLRGREYLRKVVRGSFVARLEMFLHGRS